LLARDGGASPIRYADNYLIDLKHAVIMDVEATTAVRHAEVTAAKTMIDHRLDELLPWNWDASGIGYPRSGSLIMHVNKVSQVMTIIRVAEDLGENEDWLFDVANEMDTEDGVIWVYGVGEDGCISVHRFWKRESDRSHQNP
jgi:hypothetical protein